MCRLETFLQISLELIREIGLPSTIFLISFIFVVIVAIRTMKLRDNANKKAELELAKKQEKLINDITTAILQINVSLKEILSSTSEFKGEMKGINNTIESLLQITHGSKNRRAEDTFTDSVRKIIKDD